MRLIVRPIDNCRFFGAPKVSFSIITSHEPLGTYKAFVLCHCASERDVLLSSDSSDTILKALEHLLVKSTDAVQVHISTHGLKGSVVRVVKKDNEDDGDDGVSSVSSYANNLDECKDRLADSTLSLESEALSAYESASEDDREDDGADECDVTSYVRARDSRPGSYDTRDHLSHEPPDFHGRARQRPTARNVTVAHRRRSSPPRSAPIPPAPANGYALGPSAGAGVFPFPCPTQGPAGHMPPRQRGSTGTWPVSSGPAFGPGSHYLSTLKQQQQQQQHNLFQGPPAPMFPVRTEPSQCFPPQGGNNSATHWARFTQRPTQQQPPQQLTPVKSLYQLGTNPEAPGGVQMPPMTMPPMPQMHPVLPPVLPLSNHNQPLAPSSASSTSKAYSSASSTPTLTLDPNTPPGANKADYRLVIRTEAGGGLRGPAEHRVLMRTAPTRANMHRAAVRHVLTNPRLFPREGPKPGGDAGQCRVRAVVTRAVFAAAGGREESYDLAAYDGDDFSKLCEGVAAFAEGAQGSGEERGGGAVGIGAWPLFEVVVSEVSASAAA